MVRPDRVRRSRSQRRCTVCGHPCGLSVGMSRAWWREVAAGPLGGPCGGSPVTDPKKSELATRSDELLDAVRRLKGTEQRKRQEPISSDSFHELANEVDAISHEVFSIARDQRDIGSETRRTGESIDDVEAERQRR
jgi:hypothetical protein